jgi:hypothetical protein
LNFFAHLQGVAVRLRDFILSQKGGLTHSLLARVLYRWFLPFWLSDWVWGGVNGRETERLFYRSFRGERSVLPPIKIWAPVHLEPLKTQFCPPGRCSKFPAVAVSEVSFRSLYFSGEPYPVKRSLFSRWLEHRLIARLYS